MVQKSNREAQAKALLHKWRVGPKRVKAVCQTCNSSEEILAGLGAFMEEWKSGTDPSLSYFFREVLVPLGYKFTYKTLRNHMVLHMGYDSLEHA